MSQIREVEEKPENAEEEYTPKLFSEEHSLENNEIKKDLNNYNDEEQLLIKKITKMKISRSLLSLEDKNFDDQHKTNEKSYIITGIFPFSSDVE